MQKGITLIELLIVMGIVGILAAIAIPLMKDSLLRAEISAAAADARALHVAFKRYNIDHGQYPFAVNKPAFQLNTYEPLVKLGYYQGRGPARLLGGKADGYDSPDDQGPNAEFWVELSLSRDPSVRFLVCDSDNAPLSGGRYMDGIYLFRNGVLTPL
jgi:prepilin-type N-terminal cleavage/methylation domain-containing protein